MISWRLGWILCEDVWGEGWWEVEWDGVEWSGVDWIGIEEVSVHGSKSLRWVGQGSTQMLRCFNDCKMPGKLICVTSPSSIVEDVFCLMLL